MNLIGTAGHIDHGKSALVKALTGIHPSHLPEEKKREMTIDLGYAHLKHPDGSLIGFIDVPGHEKLIRNMVAGATGMGAALLVVDAREGIKPQTLEHYHILRLLNVGAVIPVITKIALADEKQLASSRKAIGKLFNESVPIHEVDSVEGTGIGRLKEAVLSVSGGSDPANVFKPLYMPVDRCFQLKGIGTVLTGTLFQGSLKTGQEIMISSLDEPVRVRSLHNHNIPVAVAGAGQRVGVQIPGLGVDSVSRGDVILDPHHHWKAARINARVTVLGDSPLEIKNNRTFLFHTGCMETPCRLWTGSVLKPGTAGIVQLLLDGETWFHRGQRFLIRSTTPLTTIAGGMILDCLPDKPRRITGPEMLAYEEASSVSPNEQSATAPLVNVKRYLRKETDKSHSLDRLSKKFMQTRMELKARFSGDDAFVNDDSNSDWLKAEQGAYLPGLLECKHLLIDLLKAEGPSFQDGMLIAELAGKLSLPPGLGRILIERLIKENFRYPAGESSGKLTIGKDRVWLEGLVVQLSPQEQAVKNSLTSRLEKEGVQASLYKHLKLAYKDKQAVFNRVLKLMKQSGELVEIDREYSVLRKHYESMINALEPLKGSAFSIGELGRACGISRKYSVPFAEHLDTRGITTRQGNQRKIR